METVLDIEEIQQYLPHRYPFLLIDRVVELELGKYIKAYKNVTTNEPYFEGHFPGKQVVPGVLILEAMAQASGILGFKTMNKKPEEGSIYYFVGADSLRFKKPAVPIDQSKIMHHPTAIIDPKAKLDKNVEVGPYCVIGSGVKIGSGTILESHVILKGNTKIGKKNHIFQFSTIGDGSPDKKYKGEPTKLIIGDENQIREGVTIHRGTIQEKGMTRIGNRNLLLAYSHVAHDCEIEDDVVLTNQAALAGAVKVGTGAILAGYAIVHQFCSVGAHSFCAMGSTVNKDIPAFVRVRGNPAKPYGINSVGLKRLGFSSRAVEALRSAYRSIYRKNLTIEEALKELRPLEQKHKEVKLFSQTIKKSSRGIVR